MKLRFVLVALASWVYLTLGNALMACSSCNAKFNYSQDKIDAYFDTTILMAILPVSFIGLIVFIVYKTSRSANS